MSGNSGNNSGNSSGGGRISWGAILGAGAVAFLIAAAKGEAPVPDMRPDPSFSIPYFQLDPASTPGPAPVPDAAPAASCTADAVAAGIAAAGYPSIAAAQAALSIPVTGVVDAATIQAVGC